MTEQDDGCRKYRDINFKPARLQMIHGIRLLTDEYSAKGFSLTVRQIFYQFIGRGWEQPSERLYDRIQSAVNDGRMAGLIPWTAVEDRGRGLMGVHTSSSPGQAIRSTAGGYRLDLWANQPWRPEVWVEKAALEGVIGDICTRLRVDFYATRGYDSQSQSWRAGRRFADRIRDGQRPIVFHLGDHDPSGIDMTRDLTERLELFSGVPVIVQRLALNMSQIEQYDPPPNVAKLSDSRAYDYIRQYGDSSWELDALDPQVIQDLIESAIDRIRDEELWSEALAEEVEDIRVLKEIAEEFDPSGRYDS